MKYLLIFLFSLFSFTAYSFNSGITTFDIKYNGSKIRCALWYPTETTPKVSAKAVYEINSAENGKISQDIRGVVLLAHGFGGNMYGQHDTAEYLAQNGYAVLTPTYPDTDGLKSADPKNMPVFMRPAVTVQALNDLIQKDLFPRKAFDRLFMAGFSMGGYTTLMNIGAVPMFGKLDRICSSGEPTPLLCRSANKKKIKALRDKYPLHKINRLKGAVMMAPALGVFFDKESVKNVKIPLMIYSASEDYTVYGEYDSAYVASLFPQAQTRVIEGADHPVFIAPCSDYGRRKFPIICLDDEGIDRVKIHKEMNEEILKFFDSIQ